MARLLRDALNGVFVLALGLLACEGLRAADHRESPALADASSVGSFDINDVYIFQSPTNADNTVLIMTTNPFAGVLSSSQPAASTFPGLGPKYELVIDNNGDALADVIYTYQFFNVPFFNVQLALLFSFDRSSPAGQLGLGSLVSLSFTGVEATVAGGGKMRFGLSDDPFFFDLNGFNNGFEFTGDDFFAGANVVSMVLEVPSSQLTAGDSTTIGVWGRTAESFFFFDRQIDRMGFPAINTVLIPTGQKDAFNLGRPVNDPRDFGETVVKSIVELGRSEEDAQGLADLLLPDILPFDTANASGFLNGRRLEDDVIDAELDLLTAGAVTGDGVDGNDVPFRQEFPYVAPPQLSAGLR